MRRFRFRAAFFAALMSMPLALAYAQTGPQLPNPTIVGKLISVPAAAPPTGTGCTITAGSTDLAGTCLTTATSGSITFGTAFSTAPSCIVVDRTATPVAVYSVSTTAITLTTVTSAHNLVWMCVASSGG